jgi:hypothetical protein
MPVLGYPRSGNHWLKYIINYFYSLNIDHDHAHQKRFWDKYEKNEEDLLFLIIRDYRECIIKHRKISFENLTYDKLEDQLQNQSPMDKGKDDDTDYIAILRLFDNYLGSKFLVYYEDLIMEPQKEIEKLISFMKENGFETTSTLEDFMADFEKHKSTCIGHYETHHYKSATQGEKDKLSFHRNSVPKEFLDKMDTHIKHEHPHFYSKYLRRYNG